MPRVTYDPAKFEIPEGKYVCRLLRTEERPPYDGPSKFGPPSTEPRLQWVFEVVEPAALAGKLITQTTGSVLGGPKSNFTRILKGLLGRMPRTGEEIDTDGFLGKLFRVNWELNPNSESGNLHIGYLEPMQAAAGAQPSTGPKPTPPPPSRKPAPAQATHPEPKYWFDDGSVDAPREVTLTDIQAMLIAGSKPEDIALMALDQTSGWKTAKDFGIVTPF